MIELGQRPTYRVSSENELSKTFKISQITARRSVKKLTDEGFLIRSQGLRIFVAEQRPLGPMLEIRNISDKIFGRHKTTIVVYCY